MIMTPEEMAKLLESNGFKNVRRNGSHRFYFNEAAGKTTTIPFHKGDLKPGLVNAILKQAGLK